MFLSTKPVRVKHRSWVQRGQVRRPMGPWSRLQHHLACAGRSSAGANSFTHRSPSDLVKASRLGLQIWGILHLLRATSPGSSNESGAHRSPTIKIHAYPPVDQVFQLLSIRKMVEAKGQCHPLLLLSWSVRVFDAGQLLRRGGIPGHAERDQGRHRWRDESFR